jgi:hypothetical protein
MYMFEIYSESRTTLSDYMELPREVRKQHLDLSKPCVEMGGSSRSSRALLGMFLNTTCEGLGMKTGYLCHACGNEKCSNPEHLYWGSATDNSIDKFEHNPDLGRKMFNRKIEKYGEDYIKNLCKTRRRTTPRNKLAPEEVQRRLELIEGIDLTSYGWVKKVADRLGVSHTTAKEFIHKYYPGPVYKRTSPKSRA